MRKLSVIIPTHERFSSLSDLIPTIRSQDLRKELYEVIIVSNLSDQRLKSARFLKTTEGLNCKVLCAGRVGVNSARNKGIEHAKGEILLFFDDDCELIRPDYLSKIIETHEKFPNIMAIGGSYSVPEDAEVVDKAYNVIARSWQLPLYYGDFQSWRLLGGNVSYKSTLLNKAGQRFDEDIIFGASETEFHARLKSLGHKAYFFDNLTVLHRTHISEKQFFSKAYAQCKHRKLNNVDLVQAAYAYKFYEHRRNILAQRLASGIEEYDEIMLLAQVYDYIFHNIDLNKSERENVKIAKEWMKMTWKARSRAWL